MGQLTTHVLDLCLGQPAQGVAIELVRLGPEPEQCAKAITNDDGRIDKPLLQGADMLSGIYELRFDVGRYIAARRSVMSEERKFLDIVPIRFTIDDPGEHYHIPLLLSAYGYTTYRGS